MNKNETTNIKNEFKKLINNIDKVYQRNSNKPKNTLQKIGGLIDAIFIAIIMVFVGVCTLPVLALILAYGIPRSLVVKLFKALNR